MANEKQTQQQSKDTQSSRIPDPNANVKGSESGAERGTFSRDYEKDTRPEQKQEQGRKQLPQEEYPPQAQSGKKGNPGEFGTKESTRGAPRSGKY